MAVDMDAERLHRRVHLPDGRALGYAEFGDAAGTPVLYFHGMPGSRLHGRMLDESAQELGVRVIAVDRPGIGLSDFQPGRRLVDWPQDVRALADTLGLERFAIVGTSMGGPYALVCAWRLPERVGGVAVVSGAVPFEVMVDDGTDADPRMARMRKLTARAPWTLRPMATVISAAVRRSPDGCLERMTKSAAAADQALIADPDVRRLLNEGAREAFRSGSQATAHDMRLGTQPWDIPWEEIDVPVHLWHGEEDRTVAVSLARWLAERIPDCRAHFLPDAGHMLAFQHMEAILADLVQQPSVE